MRAILFGVVLAAAATSGRATDLYVSTGGADTNSGTSSDAPLKTIKAASDRAQPGDTVVLMPGTYQEAIYPTRSGTAQAPITYKSQGPAHAVLTHVQTAIFIQSVNYIVVDGIDVDGGAAAPNATVGSFGLMANTSHSVIRNGNFKYANGWGGINVTGTVGMYPAPGSTAAPSKSQGESTFDTIEDNVIDNVGNYAKNEGDVIQVRFGDTSNILVQRNIVKHGGHDLLRFDCDHCVAQDNVFNNDYRDLYGGSAGYRSVSVNGTFNVFQRNLVEHSGINGLRVDGPLAVIRGVNTIARNNVLYDGINVGFESGCGYSPSFQLTGAHIYDNTIDRVGGTAWAVWAFTGCKATGSHVFANNLVLESRMTPGVIPGAVASVPAFDADLVFVVNGGTGSLVPMNAGPTANSIIRGNIFSPARGVSPAVLVQNAGGILPLSRMASSSPNLFVANTMAKPALATAAPASLSDFRLAPSSPGVNQGVFLTTATASGNSNVVPVADTLFFSDGNGVMAGDQIQLEGSTQRAQIVSIDRNANTLKLSTAISFQSGQGVSLPYNGSAPDVGASELSVPRAPLAPFKITISH